MARRRRSQDERPGAPAWALTYGDIMSLLLVFFVLIVSFSTIQESKFSEAAASLRGAFGLASYPPTTLRLSELATARALQEQRREAGAQARKLEQTLLELRLDQDVDVEVGQGGIAVRINAPYLFDSGNAELRPEAGRLFGELAPFLGRYAYPVRIEGHTDSVPIRNARFDSNWELSAARAVAVARALQAHGMPPERLAATGCGEHRPVDTNDTAAGRARNRRVEIRLEWPR